MLPRVGVIVLMLDRLDLELFAGTLPLGRVDAEEARLLLKPLLLLHLLTLDLLRRPRGELLLEVLFGVHHVDDVVVLHSELQRESELRTIEVVRKLFLPDRT